VWILILGQRERASEQKSSWPLDSSSGYEGKRGEAEQAGHVQLGGFTLVWRLGCVLYIYLYAGRAGEYWTGLGLYWFYVIIIYSFNFAFRF
jgi:hypothetical protein